MRMRTNYKIATLAMFIVVVAVSAIGSYMYLYGNSQQCTINAPAAPIGLTVINSQTGEPVSGLPVQVTEYVSGCATVGSDPNFNLGSKTTDSNGTIMANVLGTYHFNLNYNGSKYSVAGEDSELYGVVLCLTLYVPSGQVVNQTYTRPGPNSFQCPN